MVLKIALHEKVTTLLIFNGILMMYINFLIKPISCPH